MAAAVRAPLRVLAGSRGRPEQVTLRRTDALAAPLEGIALADEALAAAERMHMAGAAEAYGAVLNEAGRLACRAHSYRAEFRRLAGLLDPRPRGAA